jgi:nuclear transport factor 2 (NTF2) superfamily protein
MIETTEGRPPLPPFDTDGARQKVRAATVASLERKWTRGTDRIAVRFACQWRDSSGNWYRSYGNECWEFEPSGPMRRRIASINDLPIGVDERRFHWPLRRRSDGHPGSSPLRL